jgi:membrane-associated protease RseP (regulator of RpoE activity)
MIWLLLLGLITYFIVQRVTGITRTPVWALWFVAMLPAFSLVGWTLAFRGQRPMPPELVILMFVLCLSLYLYLIQRGRISSTSTVEAGTPGQTQNSETPHDSQVEPLALRPINKAEESSLQTCFPWSVYYLQNFEYRPQAVICRGQLRTTPDVAYKTIRENVESKFGDRFFVVFQDGPNNKPFFALVPNPHTSSQEKSEEKQGRQTLTRPGIAIGLAVMTLFTTTLAGLQIIGKTLDTELSVLPLGLPYAIALMSFFSIRAAGHYWATRCHKIAATLPYFIPVIPLPLLPVGTVGAFIQIRSPIPDRKALFDVGVVGAIAGLVVSLALLLWGLDHSTVVSLPQKPSLFDFQALNPRFSLLLALFGKLTLGSELVAQKAIGLHPVAVAGWIGLVFTAFNLMPVGQLDGGRMVHAMFGQRTGAVIGQVSRLLFLALAFAQQHLLVWAILLLLLPATDEPALNDVTELDNARDLIGLLILAFLLVVILPAPKVVLAWLNL